MEVGYLPGNVNYLKITRNFHVKFLIDNMLQDIKSEFLTFYVFMFEEENIELKNIQQNFFIIQPKVKSVGKDETKFLLQW